MESKTPLITVDQLTIDLDKETVFLSNQPVHLTRKELGVVRLLALAGGNVVPYKKFLDVVWGVDGEDKYVYVRSVIRRIRQKLNEDLTNPRYILTDSTRGYRLGTFGLDENERPVAVNDRAGR